jgi:hypothetical protein
MSVYVLYQSKHLDIATVKLVLMEVPENNIDVSQLVEWTVDHCPQAEPSTERRSTLIDIGAGNGTHPYLY